MKQAGERLARRLNVQPAVWNPEGSSKMMYPLPYIHNQINILVKCLLIERKNHAALQIYYVE